MWFIFNYDRLSSELKFGGWAHSYSSATRGGNCKMCVFCVGTSRTRGIMGVLNRLILSAELRLMWRLMLGTMQVFVSAAALLTPQEHTDRFNGLGTGLSECVCVLPILESSDIYCRHFKGLAHFYLSYWVLRLFNAFCASGFVVLQMVLLLEWTNVLKCLFCSDVFRNTFRKQSLF